MKSQECISVRQKWEYKVVSFGEGYHQFDWEELGNEGWELVQITDDMFSEKKRWCYFKRPK